MVGHILNQTISNSSCFITSNSGVAISLICVLISLIINIPQIYDHLIYFRNPQEQKWIVRILLIIPIYSLGSFICLVNLASENYIYIQALRDCYEAFLIYAFMSLCFTYMGGETCILNYISSNLIESNWLACTCCLAGRVFDIRHLRFCKRASLQFCFIKVIAAIVTIILHRFDLYHEGNFSPSYGYLYVNITYNISYSLALYGLFFFYLMTKIFLNPYNPLFKFLTIKFIMFLSYYQYIILIFIMKVSDRGYCKEMSVTTVSNGILFFLLTVEMIITAVMLRISFPHSIYRYGSLVNDYNSGLNNRTILISSLQQTLNPADFLRDSLHNFSKIYRNYTSVLIQNDADADVGLVKNSENIDYNSYTNQTG